MTSSEPPPPDDEPRHDPAAVAGPGGRVRGSPTVSDGLASAGSASAPPRVLRRLAGRPPIRRRRRMIADDRPVGTPLTMRPRTLLSWQRTVMSSAIVAVLMMIRLWVNTRGYLVLVPFAIFVLPIPWVALRVRQIRAQPEPDPPDAAPLMVAVSVILYAVTAIMLMIDQIVRYSAG